MVDVGDAGNAADAATGFGGVSYAYAIGKYEVTVGQYTAFLNAVASADPYGLYNANMGTDMNVAGISRSGSSGSYTYAVMVNGGNSANRPITYVTWFAAARFANWLANGQPVGTQSRWTTENGAYALNGATSGNSIAKNTINPNTGNSPTFRLPSEDEWYKAAYYKGGGTNSGYWLYPTQSNAVPSNIVGAGANRANFDNGVFSITQSSTYLSSQNYLTDAGQFSGSASYYGTFDQGGNAQEWMDTTDGTFRAACGDEWDSWNLV